MKSYLIAQTLWKMGSPIASFNLGCHFDHNEVKGAISHSRKVWNFRLHRLGEISPEGRNDIPYLAHLKTCSRTVGLFDSNPRLNLAPDGVTIW